MPRPAPVLHRNDPDKAPLIGHVKVTRADWLNLARDTLVNDGMAEVKILGLAERLKVSRSSFYWYFKSRSDLLDALLADWEARNIGSIVEHCAMQADTITEALCHFFKCFVNPALFDPGLDFAVREWSRRDKTVRSRVDRADETRLTATREMFARHGYDPEEADIRARILYFMQLGYHALDQKESLQTRMTRFEGFLRGFSGQEPTELECETFKNYAQQVAFR